MAISLPVYRGLFNKMQEALFHVKGKRVVLSKGIHEALADLLWLAEDVSKRPTRIYEIVPLRLTVDGYHDASSYMCGGVVLPGPTTIPWVLPLQTSAAQSSLNPTASDPVVWRAPFPKYVVDSLVSCTNPQGTFNNYKLELTGGIIHIDCVAQCFVVTERAVLSRTDNTTGIW